MEQENSINSTNQINLQDQSQRWSVKEFLFSSPKLILSELFFALNVLFIGIILFSLSDHILNICSYSRGELGSLNVSCPSLLFWYEIPATFLGDAFLWFFISIFFVFLPEVVFVVVYIFAFTLLARKKEEVEFSVNKDKEKQIKVLNILRLSLVAMPLLLVFSITLIHWTASDSMQKRYAAIANETEKKYQDTVKNNPDFCQDAPEEIYLTTSDSSANPRLFFNPGYWKGDGVAYLSRENYWDGISEDPNMEFHVETYSPSIIRFSSSSVLAFSPNPSLGKLPVGGRYDLHVFTLNDKMYYESGRNSDEYTTDKINFYRGVFKQRSGVTFTLSSSTMITKEPCLTVKIK